MSKKETKTEKSSAESVAVPAQLHERVLQLLKEVGTTVHGQVGHDARELLEDLT